jgi:hypothetical protein
MPLARYGSVSLASMLGRRSCWTHCSSRDPIFGPCQNDERHADGAYARECTLVGAGVLAGPAGNPIAFVAAAADLAFSAATALGCQQSLRRATTYRDGGPPADLGTGHRHVSLVGGQLFIPARDRQGEVSIILSFIASELEQSHSSIALVVAGNVFRGNRSTVGTLVYAVGIGGAASGHDKAGQTIGLKAGWQKRRKGAKVRKMGSRRRWPSGL